MSGQLYDAPNQQVVRADGSGPWDEGEGGSGVAAASTAEPSLDEMTKEQLLERAQELGISPANAAMSKAELRAAIDAKLAEE